MTDVSCPDPDEIVNRRILQEEIEKLRAEFKVDFKALEENLRRALNADLAQHLGAYEERRKLERIEEHKGLVEDMRDALRAMFEIEAKDRLDDHEARLTRL